MAPKSFSQTEIFRLKASAKTPLWFVLTGTTVELLEAILQYLPLDQYVEKPVALMKVVDGDPCKPTIWDSYKQKLNESGNDPAKIEMVERFAFYERARHAYAIIATGESAIYANVLLKKGVVQ